MGNQKPPMSRKARLMLLFGCLCLSLGTGLPIFLHPAAGTGRLWMDGARGLLLGLAIALNLGAFLLGRKREHDLTSR